MPFAGFENFDACLTDADMIKRYPDEETRRKVCGSLQAKAEKEHSYHDDSNPMRELRAKISFGKYHEHEGGLLVKDVKLLASGVWIDSHIGTPLFYPEKVLEKYADNWIDNSLWSRHSGGMSRSIIDKIGEVRNYRYQNEAVIGDLWLHEKTQTSRDAAELIKAGLVNYVSVEHGGKERWNATEKRYDAEEIIFGGVAIVNRGACKVCTINNEQKETEGTILTDSHSWAKEALDNMIKEDDIKKLEAERQLQEASRKDPDIAALEAQLGEVSKQRQLQRDVELESAKAKIAELEQVNAETLRKLAAVEHDGRVRELQAEIAKLTAQPVYHTKITSGEKATTIRELELDNDEFPAYTAKDFGE